MNNDTSMLGEFGISLSKLNSDDEKKIRISAGKRYLEELIRSGAVTTMGWDKPMSAITVDGLKVNSIIYDAGGGVQNGLSSSSRKALAQQAAEVRKYIDETGKLPVTKATGPNSSGPNSPYNSYAYLYDDEMAKWVLGHSDIRVDELYHSGTKGQKWGVRRYQNKDGSLTEEGRRHYNVGPARDKIKNTLVTGAHKTKDIFKSGANKAKDTIRKKVKPTDEELLDDYNVANKKKARKDLKKGIKDLKRDAKPFRSKKKSLSYMSDAEVAEALQRRKNELALKELNKSPMQRMLEDYASNSIKKALDRATDKAIDNWLKEKKEKSAQDILNEQRAALQLQLIAGRNSKDEKANREADKAKELLKELKATDRSKK